MGRLLLVLLLGSFPGSAQEYWHRASGSFGAFVPAAGTDTVGFGTAPVLSFDYAFRFHRHGQFDTGVDAAFASRAGERTNVYIPRVGYSLVLPLLEDRLEAIAGAGGAYSFFKPQISQESWLVYGQLGATWSIDPDRRYRAGVTMRWYRDPIGTPVQQWVSVGAVLSYSFGR